jgi:hypothetical protein
MLVTWPAFMSDHSVCRQDNLQVVNLVLKHTTQRIEFTNMGTLQQLK